MTWTEAISEAFNVPEDEADFLLYECSCFPLGPFEEGYIDIEFYIKQISEAMGWKPNMTERLKAEIENKRQGIEDGTIPTYDAILGKSSLEQQNSAGGK